MTTDIKVLSAQSIFQSKENSKLSNPIANAQDANSSSGGYAAGGRPDSLGTKGGIAEQAPNGYSRPDEKLPASGVMYQDSADGAKGSAFAGKKSVICQMHENCSIQPINQENFH